ncbi:MAG TPA: ABC transporter permease [Opitutaceae bacterium]|jgi:lipopolysaccharide transport system permease protein
MSGHPESAGLPDAPPAREDLVIEANRGDSHYWRDLWLYRDLFVFLTLRDIKVRYKQTVLGVGWALIQPIVTTIIFTFVFGKLAGMSAGGVPYPLLVLAGLLPWQLFSAALTGSSASLISNANLISKVYFPRLVIPLSSLGVALLDFMVVLGLYLCVSVWFGRIPSWHWALIPIFIASALLLAFGAGIWFTALTVKYRDFRYIVPFAIQVGVFISPIGFSTSVVPSWRHLLEFNPITGVIDAFRWALLSDGQPFDGHGLLTSLVISTIVTVTGLMYFRRMEKTFADII